MSAARLRPFAVRPARTGPALPLGAGLALLALLAAGCASSGGPASGDGAEASEPSAETAAEASPRSDSPDAEGPVVPSDPLQGERSDRPPDESSEAPPGERSAAVPGGAFEDPSAGEASDAGEAPDPLEDDPLADSWLDEGPTPDERDPLEPVNRRIHGFNEVVHQWFFDPVAGAYEWAVPTPGRRAIFRLFENLGEPVTFVNHVLQLEPTDAGATGARFLVNSTVGVVGLFDPAERVGLDQRPTDFGQTLAVYRVGSGPYLVVPVLGPATLRDAFGGIVDAALRPDFWLLGAGTQFFSLAAGQGLAFYDAQHERIDALRETSIDFYSALRAAYLMSRDARVEARLDEVRSGPEEDGDAVGVGAALEDPPAAGEGREAPGSGSSRPSPAD